MLFIVVGKAYPAAIEYGKKYAFVVKKGGNAPGVGTFMSNLKYSL